jgi:hypothetical protein
VVFDDNDTEIKINDQFKEMARQSHAPQSALDQVKIATDFKAAE